jgi:hypothetical protein
MHKLWKLLPVVLLATAALTTAAPRSSAEPLPIAADGFCPSCDPNSDLYDCFTCCRCSGQPLKLCGQVCA